MQGLTPEQRCDLARAANIARRGALADDTELRHKAVAKADLDCWNGLGEQDVVARLTDRGVVVGQQVAAGPYNIDLVVDDVAIEVHRRTISPERANAQRIDSLLSDGWRVAYLWCGRGARNGNWCFSEQALDRLVAFILDRSEYASIRCQ